MTKEQKALAACQAYVQAKGNIKRLTKAIATTLSECKGVKGQFYLEQGEYDNFPTRYGEDTTHLGKFFSDVGTAEAVGMDGAPTLADLETACPHCRRAYDLVQERKEARKAFGVAKRAISAAGRAEA